MSWEISEYDEYAPCACGEGYVIKHCAFESDDWGRCRNEIRGYGICCPHCKEKYYVEGITMHYKRREPTDTEYEIYSYLVPNGLRFPTSVRKREFWEFYKNAEEEIACTFRKDILANVINDMEKNKSAARVQMPESKEAIKICKRELRSQAVKKIIPYLKGVLENYEAYEWNPDTIAAYREEEKKDRKERERSCCDTEKIA